MTDWQAGMISTLTLLGYALGLLLLVPLVDLVENKRLILRTLACAIVAALGTALAPTPAASRRHLRSRRILRCNSDDGPARCVDGRTGAARTGDRRGDERI